MTWESFWLRVIVAAFAEGDSIRPYRLHRAAYAVCTYALEIEDDADFLRLTS
jgi:hypothetical protein